MFTYHRPTTVQVSLSATLYYKVLCFTILSYNIEPCYIGSAMSPDEFYIGFTFVIYTSHIRQ